MCLGQESNLHDQKRSLGPQHSAAANSTTWAERRECSGASEGVL